MKKLLYMIVVLCGMMTAAPAFADEWEGLSLQARERVQQQAREMSQLGIPEVPARQMLITMHRNRFTERNMTQARQMVMDAARAGLPTEAIMGEAMTGMARQAREQEVVRAMETVHNRYAYADRMARSLATEPRRIETMRTAMVDCLATGVRPADLEAVHDQLQVQARSQTRQRTQNRAEDEALAVQTMLTVATMARRGVGSPEIADILGRALQQRYTYREMEQLRQRFANRSMQEAPRETAARHAASIGRGDGPGPAAGPGASGSPANGGAGSGSGGSSSGGDGGGNAGGGSGSNSGGGNTGGGSGGGNTGGNAGGGNSGGGHGGGR